MNVNTLKSVYFIGAGGIGMSALVRYFLSKGKKVGGYDRTPSELTEKLIEEGAAIHYISSTSFYLSFKESTIVRRAAIHAGSAALNRLMTTQKTNASRNTHGLNSASMFKLNSPDVPTF